MGLVATAACHFISYTNCAALRFVEFSACACSRFRGLCACLGLFTLFAAIGLMPKQETISFDCFYSNLHFDIENFLFCSFNLFQKKAMAIGEEIA